MNRRIIYTLIAILIIGLVIILYPSRSNALWGNTLSYTDGTRIDYNVHGYSSGEPIAGLLLIYDNNVGLPSPVTYKSTGNKDGTRDFMVNNQLVKPTDHFQLFINQPDGRISKVEIPLDQAIIDFSQQVDHSKQDLKALWGKYATQKIQ